jgi:hypothetical protein
MMPDGSQNQLQPISEKTVALTQILEPVNRGNLLTPYGSIEWK